jgi:hypothetical protein
MRVADGSASIIFREAGFHPSCFTLSARTSARVAASFVGSKDSPGKTERGGGFVTSIPNGRHGLCRLAALTFCGTRVAPLRSRLCNHSRSDANSSRKSPASKVYFVLLSYFKKSKKYAGATHNLN